MFGRYSSGAVLELAVLMSLDALETLSSISFGVMMALFGSSTVIEFLKNTEKPQAICRLMLYRLHLTKKIDKNDFLKLGKKNE